MIIRALDASHDWKLGKGVQDYLHNELAIEENIQTRLLSILNDCFFDLGAGVDWFRLLSNKNTLQEITLSCKAIILASYGVVKVNNIVPILSGRNLVINYNIDTIFTRQVSQTLEV